MEIYLPFPEAKKILTIMLIYVHFSASIMDFMTKNRISMEVEL